MLEGFSLPSYLEIEFLCKMRARGHSRIARLVIVVTAAAATAVAACVGTADAAATQQVGSCRTERCSCNGGGAARSAST